MTRVPEPISERLDRFTMPVTESGCWLWTGTTDGGGYGSIRISGKMIKAHRASWMIHRGQIPEGLSVLHKCDVRLCVNPDHLFLGTYLDNARDMVAKGRRKRTIGQQNPNAKLTQADVDLIRTMSGSHTEIARKFGVGKSIIGYIRSGKNWK